MLTNNVVSLEQPGPYLFGYMIQSIPSKDNPKSSTVFKFKRLFWKGKKPFGYCSERKNPVLLYKIGLDIWGHFGGGMPCLIAKYI